MNDEFESKKEDKNVFIDEEDDNDSLDSFKYTDINPSPKTVSNKERLLNRKISNKMRKLLLFNFA